MKTSTMARSEASKLSGLEVPETDWEAALYPLLLLPQAYQQSDACLPNLSNVRGTHLISLSP